LIAKPYVAAADDVEETIISVWREVLDVERVGVNDAFFDLGGHSLLLAQVRDRLSSELGGELTMLDLLQYPTVGKLAAHFRQSAEHDASEEGRDRGADRRRGRSRQQASARRAARDSERAVK
jgi:acyl carrier protein